MTDPKETFASAAATEWQPSRFPGVSRKVLRNDTESGESAALVRLEPGASVPAHDHPAGEEVFVLEGDVAASDRGCVFLVTLPKPVVMLKDA
jgi:quercetin dioxygenase-like cupin family protein